MKFKIAIVQFKTLNGQPEKNLRKAEFHVSKAKAQKVDVIIFPEEFISGDTSKDRSLVDKEKKHIRLFQSMAKKYRIDIVAGSIIEKRGKAVYNICYYVNNEGVILGHYKKNHPYITERHITAGTEIAVFNTRFGKAGLAICWDLAYPELFRKMLPKGVDIVYCPSFWWTPAKDRIHEKRYALSLDALCLTRAFENNIILVYCNSAENNASEEKIVVGRSQVVCPFRAIRRVNHSREAMFIAEIDTTLPQKIEDENHLRADFLSK